MSRNDINYVRQFFKFNGKPKLCEELKNRFNLHNQLQFIYNQITHYVSKSRRKVRSYRSGFRGPYLMKYLSFKQTVQQGQYLTESGDSKHFS